MKLQAKNVYLKKQMKLSKKKLTIGWDKFCYKKIEPNQGIFHFIESRMGEGHCQVPR